MERKNYLTFAVMAAGLVLFLQSGCQRQLQVPAESKIRFEEEIHNFGELGPREKGECEFRFKNTGDGILKIEKVATRACRCTPYTLEKRQYRPERKGR